MVSDSWETTHNWPEDAVICQDQLGTTMEVQITVVHDICMHFEPGLTKILEIQDGGGFSSGNFELI